MRRRGTGAQGAARRQAQLLPGGALRGSPAARAGPQPPPAARGPLSPTGSTRPPHHRRTARPTSPQPARAPAPTLVTEETPQLGEYQAHAWPRLPAEPRGHPELSQAAAAATPAAPFGRTQPAAAPGQQRRGAGTQRCPAPGQRPHDARGRPNAYTAVAPRHAMRHHVRPRRAASTGAAAGPASLRGELRGEAGLFPRLGEEPRGLGPSAAGEEGAAPPGRGAAGDARSPPGVDAAPGRERCRSALAASLPRHRVAQPGGAVAGPRPSL